MIVTCEECGKEFDITIPEQAEDWAYGHDCEEG